MEMYSFRDPLEPELDPMDTAGLPQIATPWSENETKLMNQLFPRLDSLCLNFGSTGVFQWNEPNLSTLKYTTQWPQGIAGTLPRLFNQNGITSTRTDPQPQMPYFVFRNMSPHFDSYANSGIPDIRGTELHLYNWDEGDRNPQLLHLLPHLQLSDVETCMEHRIGDLQMLAKAIIDRTGRRPASHPNHSTTRRLTQLNAHSLQCKRRQFGITAEEVIHILCKTDLPDALTEEGYIASATDYLGYPIGNLRNTGVDTWGTLKRSESAWGNWFGIIGQVFKSWHRVAQKRRSNPSHITIHDWYGDLENWTTYGGRILREIKTSYKTYTKLHSIYVGHRAIQNKAQAHDLVNILCNLVPTLNRLHMPDTTAELGLRAAKTLAIRGLGLRDSIQLVTWLHGLPVTRAKDFWTLMRNSPRATVIHVLEGCEQIALLNLVTQGYLPDKALQDVWGHPIGKQLLPFVLVFDRELFPRLTYMQNLITHIRDFAAHIPRITANIITYEPLEDRGEEYVPLPRPDSTHPHLRPTVKRGLFDNPYAHWPGEQPCKDLEYDDLMELYGYDEERGLSLITLEKGTKIEIPIEDEYGAKTWIAGKTVTCVKMYAFCSGT